MSWNYAELSKAAKLAGGPEKYVEGLINGSKALGRSAGRSEMVPWLFVACGIGSAVQWGIHKLIDVLNEPTQEEVEVARQNLIQGIKNFDAAHDESTGKEDYTNE